MGDFIKIRAEKDRLIAEGKIKRDKPLAAVAEEEKPFGLPEGWEWTRIDEVAEVQGGIQKTQLRRPVKEHYPYLRVANVQRDALRLVEIERFEMTQEELAKWRLVSGDLLIVEGNGSADEIGRCAVWDGSIDPCVYQNHLIRVRCLQQDCMAFIKLFLNAPSGMEEMKRLAITTSGLYNLSVGKIRNFVVPVPPLPEQSRIVTRVEELMRLCDALQAKGRLEAAQHAQLVSTLLGALTASATPEELADHWQRVAQHFDLLLDRPEAIDALEQTLLQLAVRGLLVPQDPADEPASALLACIRTEKDRLIAAGQIKRDKPLPPITDEEKPFELPVGWGWARVSDVVEMLNGYAFKSEWFKTTGVRLLRNLNISHGYVDWSQPAAIDTPAAGEFQQFALQAGDIVLSLDHPIISTGLKYAVIRGSDLPCLLLQRVARLAPHVGALSGDFLVLWLQSDFFVGTIDPGRSNGVPHISTKQVGGLAFALPPLPEQSRIVTRVTALRRLCFELRQRLSERQSVQARLAEALVH